MQEPVTSVDRRSLLTRDDGHGEPFVLVLRPVQFVVHQLRDISFVINYNQLRLRSLHYLRLL